MSALVCFGFGYAAQHYVAAYGGRFERIVGTTRSAESAALLSAQRFGGRAVETIVFDGAAASPALLTAVNEATMLVVSIAPNDGADPVLTRLGEALAQAPRLAVIVYLSTIAVYGNHDGGWIDETTPLTPVLGRAGERIEAESAWQALGTGRGVPVAVIRIAGIYGPGANSLVAVKAGRARRVVKPGQVFNRIHVDDLAQIIEKAAIRGADGVFNAADDEPSPPGDPIAFAASLMGVPAPPEIAFEDARKTMTPMALSFYGECKRVRNDRIKSVLGVALRYPTYREGLRALAASVAA